MITLNLLDYFFIGIYIVTILYIGYRSKIGETEEGFLIADRELGSVEGAATVVASNTGGGLILTGVALTYVLGFSAMWFFVGAAIGYIVFGFFGSNIRKDSTEKKFYTLADYYFDKYGKVVGYTVATMSLFIVVTSIILQLIGGAKLLGSLTGISFVWSLLSIGVTIGVYLIWGGFKAVVKTDVVQTIAILALTILVGVVMAHGKVWELFARSFEIGKNVPITTIIGFFLMGIFVPFASPELWQRIYASKNPKTVRNSFVMSGFLYIIVGLSLLLVGLAVGANVTVVDPDLALIQGFATLLPPGLIGLGLVMLLAAIMSSADTYFFTSTSILLQDFYLRFKKITPSDFIKLFRYSLVVFIIAGLFFSWVVQSLVSAAFFWAGINMALSIPLFVTWIFKRTSRVTMISGIVIGFIGTVVLSIISPINEELVLNSIILTTGGLVLGSLYELVRYLCMRHKTKFVLHGGFNKERGPIQKDDLFFHEILKGTPKEVNVLLVYFAEKEEKIPSRIEQDTDQFNKNKDTHELNFKVPTEESFLADCAWANVIYLHGGQTVRLMGTLEKYSNLKTVFAGKIIAGDSAGAKVLGQSFYSNSTKEFGQGVGILPFNIVAHYVVGDTNPFADDEPKTKTIFINEYETKVLKF